MQRHIKTILFFTGILLAFWAVSAPEGHAESLLVLKSKGMMDSVLQKYQSAAKGWVGIIQKKASWLFITLATISMVWTFAQLLFHRSSLAELFGEMIRFVMFTGFFLWLLNNAPDIAGSIIVSLQKIGSEAAMPTLTASGTPPMSPSSVMDIGFKVFLTAKAQLGTHPATWLAFIIAIIVLVILALVSINMLLQLCAAWVLAYAGIFFLGFGGSRWTSDMAVNYFKTVLGIGASLMTMTLLVGVGTGIIADAQSRMSQQTLEMDELAVLKLYALTLFLLVDKLPSMVAGIVTGAGIGSMGVGAFGAGAAVGAAMTAAGAAMGAASMAGSMASSTVTGAAGALSALKAAAQSVSGAMSGGGSTGGGEGGTGRSLSDAMGVKTRFATEVGKTLAKGAAGMAKSAFQEKVGNTFGGRLASHLKGNQQGGQ